MSPAGLSFRVNTDQCHLPPQDSWSMEDPKWGVKLSEFQPHVKPLMKQGAKGTPTREPVLGSEPSAGAWWHFRTGGGEKGLRVIGQHDGNAPGGWPFPPQDLLPWSRPGFWWAWAVHRGQSTHLLISRYLLSPQNHRKATSSSLEVSTTPCSVVWLLGLFGKEEYWTARTQAGSGRSQKTVARHSHR